MLFALGPASLAISYEMRAKGKAMSLLCGNILAQPHKSNVIVQFEQSCEVAEIRTLPRNIVIGDLVNHLRIKSMGADS